VGAGTWQYQSGNIEELALGELIDRAGRGPVCQIDIARCPLPLRLIAELRLMCEEVAMPWDWPAEVNQLEAAAFCRWKADQD
jgi:hypothetical protein